MKDEIKKIIKAREIPYLIHFTQLSNLESILEHGILSRAKLDQLNINVCINDTLRLDNHADSSSISISFPNHRMFYKLRQESKILWCVIVLHPQILWKYDCAFCQHNAADARISTQDINGLKNSASLECMFEEIIGYPTRKAQGLKNYDPTDDQAEVLVFDTISKDYIGGVVFNNNDEREKFVKSHPNLKSWYHSDGRGLFSSRNYFRKYSE